MYYVVRYLSPPRLAELVELYGKTQKERKREGERYWGKNRKCQPDKFDPWPTCNVVFHSKR